MGTDKSESSLRIWLIVWSDDVVYRLYRALEFRIKSRREKQERKRNHNLWDFTVSGIKSHSFVRRTVRHFRISHFSVVVIQMYCSCVSLHTWVMYSTQAWNVCLGFCIFRFKALKMRYAPFQIQVDASKIAFQHHINSIQLNEWCVAVLGSPPRHSLHPTFTSSTFSIAVLLPFTSAARISRFLFIFAPFEFIVVNCNGSNVNKP